MKKAQAALEQHRKLREQRLEAVKKTSAKQRIRKTSREVVARIQIRIQKARQAVRERADALKLRNAKAVAKTSKKGG